jgi:hypothetical protein
MPAVGEKACEPFFDFRRGVRLGDAKGIEAECPCLVGKRGFDFRWIVQKSRSA